MSESMRKLFSRRGVSDEVVSLRNSLTNPLGGTAIVLRTALTTFDRPAGGDGLACVENLCTGDITGIGGTVPNLDAGADATVPMDATAPMDAAVEPDASMPDDAAVDPDAMP